ncbi:MAG: undecaprenyldiphospho-muramoylpentapeptide beta-N-acetylglucosaminyltransferase [Clostridia bacterium]
MRIIVTGGGTAGHINPALAIASYFKEKHSETQILYIGNHGGMEEKLVPAAGYDFKSVKISGFRRKLSPQNICKNISTIFKVFKSSSDAKKIIKQFNPDLCIGTGGYVCGPVILAAIKLGVPSFVHESNSYPGVTVKMLAKKVDAVMLATEHAKQFFDKNTNIVVTGNPVRQTMIGRDKDEARKKLGLNEKPMILSFGGSLGSAEINKVIAPFLERSSKDNKYQHIHGYGMAKEYQNYKNEIKIDKENKSLCVLEYISNMPDCLAAADLVISRAGAMTVAEISVMGKASILIPSPNVTENHQFHNAMSLVNAGAADIIEEKDLSAKILMEKADKILESRETINKFSENAKKVYSKDALEKIYQISIKAIKILSNK